MADFTQGSKFNKEDNFQSVKFGADAPLLEVELNEMQDIQNEARADIIRESIPSGFTKLSDLDYEYMSTNPNCIKLKDESVAFVNGYKITIPTGTVIPLNAPPTKDFVNAEGKKGTREDLVFLEVWKEEVTCDSKITSNGDVNGAELTNNIKDKRVGVETSRRIQLKYRLRVVDNVDSRLNGDIGAYWEGNLKKDSGIPAWGSKGSDSPYLFYSLTFSKGYGVNSIDSGLCSTRTLEKDSVRNDLKALDGYVYAIPMFRVHRRNDGGYSVDNGNGSRSFYLIDKCLDSALNKLETAQIKVTNEEYSQIKVGDVLGCINTYTIVSKDDNNMVTICANLGPVLNLKTYPLISSDRPDRLFNNIVDERDIVDLRHQVSLTGFDFHKLLEDNFTSLLKGELQTKEKTKMLKTYHGIPKTPIDSNTVFYASFDGTTNAEVGGKLDRGEASFKSHVTGCGLDYTRGSTLEYNNKININALSGSITVDSWIEFNNNTGNQIHFMDTQNKCGFFIEKAYTTGNLYLTFKNSDTYSGQVKLGDIKPMGLYHLRAIVNLSSKLIDVKLNGTSIAPQPVSFSHINCNAKMLTDIMLLNFNCCDLSVSNIDRGNTFATLPQDFIDRYATIAPAFNEQRNVYSDALTSENKKDILKASGEVKRQYTLTQYSKGSWTKGDLIKVKGLGGEVIGGVIDSDTALAKIVGYIDPQNIIVDDVSKLQVGDEITPFIPNWTSYTRTITNIDTNTNKVTFTGEPANSTMVGFNLLETTESSSSPSLKFDKGGTITNVNGRWNGLGTNEATFILDTTDGLTNQDLQIVYSLNEVPGQGGISEVFTKTLAGEINGKKLVVNPPSHIIDDFKGKVAGSTKENPSTTKYTYSEELMSPQNFSKELNIDYSKINKKDDICSTVTVNATQDGKGKIPQMLFSFNIVEIVEQKYGKIPELNLAGKVQWCKDNIKTIICNWWGYGSCPDGNKVYLDAFVINGGFWNFNNANEKSKISHTESFSKKLAIGHKYPNNWIDSKGFIHFIVYTDASDGVTPSTIFTDYINISITLKTPGGYDVLAPENPRRDDGQSNILLVRKETKEIQVMFDGLDYNSKVVTYGEYNPNQNLPYVHYSDEDSLVKSDKVFLTTQGTAKGGCIPFAERLFIGRNSNVIGDLKPYKLTNEDVYYNKEYSWSNVHTSSAFDYINLSEVDKNIAKGGVGLQIFNKKISSNTLLTSCKLILDNGRLILGTESARFPTELYRNQLEIQNRPLIK